MLGRLHTLILNDNALKYLSPFDFKQQRHLQHLNVAGNMLRVLPENLFDGLDKLKDLNLERNFIDVIPDDVFFDAPRLVSLNIRSNRLRRLDVEALLSTLIKLKFLDAGRNSISNITVPDRINQRFVSRWDTILFHLFVSTPF